MLLFRRDKAQLNTKAAKPKEEPSSQIENAALSRHLEENISLIKKLFCNDDTLVIRSFENHRNTDIKCCIFFIDGMANPSMVDESIIKPIILAEALKGTGASIDDLQYHVLVSSGIMQTSEMDKIITAIVSGDTVLFMEGTDRALTINSKGWQTRAIEEPESEKLIKGPKEGFTESLLMNLSMLRRRLATNNLKFVFSSLGTQSHTRICICYIEGIANPQILNELNSRLKNIDIDGLMSSEVIEEFIRDFPFTPFKTVGSTERPDVIGGRLLEGRIAIFVDGTPIVLTVPFIFVEYFQSNEDYNVSFFFSTINRLLRILSFILTISLPAVYVALTSFHMEMVPTPMIKSISAARQSVPFPTVIEVILLLIAFELLREAGTRMPTNVGQALSIVGALVLGQAAVEARIVSAPVVIIVALTGITGLALPKMKGGEIITRSILLIFSSIIGLYGYIFGLIGLLIHLFEIRSFGIPYMLSLSDFKLQEIKDTAIRVPWFYMKLRPKHMTSGNKKRQGPGGKKK